MNEWDGALLVFKRLLKSLILPPTGFLLLAFAGVLLSRWRRTSGTVLAGLCLVLAYASGTQIVAHGMINLVIGQDLRALQPDVLRAQMAGSAPPGAIVILGGGASADSRDWPSQHSPSARGLERLVHGARLARISGLPVLISGGSGIGASVSEAEVMGEVLSRDFGIQPRWLEKNSLDTWDNAFESARLLKPAGVSRVVLVTHAIHMKRAIRAFEANGLQVIAAPSNFLGAKGHDDSWSRWLPDGDSGYLTWMATYELLGEAWYLAGGR